MQVVGLTPSVMSDSRMSLEARLKSKFNLTTAGGDTSRDDDPYAFPDVEVCRGAHLTESPPDGPSPIAKLYPELAEKLERVRGKPETPRVAAPCPATGVRGGVVGRTMNRLQTKIAQKKLKDRLKQRDAKSPIAATKASDIHEDQDVTLKCQSGGTGTSPARLWGSPVRLMTSPNRGLADCSKSPSPSRLGMSSYSIGNMNDGSPSRLRTVSSMVEQPRVEVQDSVNNMTVDLSYSTVPGVIRDSPHQVENSIHNNLSPAVGMPMLIGDSPMKLATSPAVSSSRVTVSPAATSPQLRPGFSALFTNREGPLTVPPAVNTPLSTAPTSLHVPNNVAASLPAANACGDLPTSLHANLSSSLPANLLHSLSPSLLGNLTQNLLPGIPPNLLANLPQNLTLNLPPGLPTQSLALPPGLPPHLSPPGCVAFPHNWPHIGFPPPPPPPPSAPSPTQLPCSPPTSLPRTKCSQRKKAESRPSTRRKRDSTASKKRVHSESVASTTSSPVISEPRTSIAEPWPSTLSPPVGHDNNNAVIADVTLNPVSTQPTNVDAPRPYTGLRTRQSTCVISMDTTVTKRLCHRSALSMYKCQLREKDHALLPVGVDDSSDDDSNDVDDVLPWQQEWVLTSSDEENDDDDIDTAIPAAIRLTKVSLLRSKLRRQLLQLRRCQRANATQRKCEQTALCATLRAGRACAKDAASVVIATTKTTAKTTVNKPRAHLHELPSQACLHRSDEDEKPCGAPSLPYANHCLRHIMYNIDQQVFDLCTAKFADNTQCCVPAFDLRHELPLCAEHAAKTDNYQRSQGVRPKKPRKKTKPSALTRPPKKGKKKRNMKKAAAMQKAPPTIDSVADNIPFAVDVDGSPTQIEIHHNKDDYRHKDLQKDLDNELEDDLDESFSPGVIDKTLGLDTAAEFLDEDDLHDVLNRIPEEAFDLFTSKNGFLASREEDEALEQALAQVSQELCDANDSLALLDGSTPAESDELARLLATSGPNVALDDQLSALANSMSASQLHNISQVLTSSELNSALGDTGAFVQPVMTPVYRGAPCPTGLQTPIPCIPQLVAQNAPAPCLPVLQAQLARRPLHPSAYGPFSGGQMPESWSPVPHTPNGVVLPHAQWGVRLPSEHTSDNPPANPLGESHLPPHCQVTTSHTI